jgi:hypothetical protein
MPRKPKALVLDSWAVLAYLGDEASGQAGRGGSQYPLALIVLRDVRDRCNSRCNECAH